MMKKLLVTKDAKKCPCCLAVGETSILCYDCKKYYCSNCIKSSVDNF